MIDFECDKILLTGNCKVTRGYSFPPTGHMALTNFSERKADRSPQLRKLEAQSIDEQVPATLRPEVTMLESKSWLVRPTENVNVTPRCRQIIFVRLESEENNVPPLVCVQPAQIPTKHFHESG